MSSVWVNSAFELSEISLSPFGGHQCNGLATEKIAGKLVGNCRNHTTVFTQEREWATARQEDVGRSGSSVCSTAICILGVISLCDNRVRVCGVDLVTFNIHPNQPKLVERDFGHPFKLVIGFKRNSNFPLFGIVLLIFPPQRRIANTGPGASNTLYNRPKATFQGKA